MNDLLLLIASASVVATAIVVLQSPSELLDWMPDVLYKILPDRIAKLLTCAKCIAGQIAFWYYLIYSILNDSYIWQHHVVAVSGAILLTIIVASVIDRIW